MAQSASRIRRQGGSNSRTEKATGEGHAGIRNAQHLLGHAGISTTEIYVGRPTLDELAGSVEGFVFDTDERTDVLGGPEAPAQPSKATTGIEPVYTALQAAA